LGESSMLYDRIIGPTIKRILKRISRKVKVFSNGKVCFLGLK
jgi:hypothetical protein